MLQQDKIAKVVWEARKAFRPWDPESPIKKWSMLPVTDKKALVAVVKDRMDGKPDIPFVPLANWTEDEMKLLYAITDCLKTVAM